MKKYDFSVTYKQIHGMAGIFNLSKLPGGATNEALNALIKELEARGYKDADDDTNREPGTPVVLGSNRVPLYRHIPKTASVWIFE